MLKAIIKGFAITFISCQLMAQASQADLIFATKIYNRINSVKKGIDEPVIQQMALQISKGDLSRAAQIAADEDNFINITVRDFAVRMSTREEAVGTSLNDFTATIMGIVRDNLDARTMLYGDFFYRGSQAEPLITRNEDISHIYRSNDHYAQIESLRLNAKQLLVKERQQILRRNTTLEVHPDPAGVLSSRAFMEAHHSAGTGRRPVEFTFREFLCLGIDEVADNTGPDDRIGRDIPRFPGGDHNEFKTNCKSCHVPMDGFRGAFAFFTFANTSVRYGNVEGQGGAAGVDGFDRVPASDGSQNYVSRKFNWNTDQYPQGYVTNDDSWVNYANYGKNKSLIAWPDKYSGKGLRAFGEVVANTKAFPKCMAKRVFTSLCKRSPSSLETKFIEEAGAEFESNNYNLRQLFEKVAVSKECVGE